MSTGSTLKPIEVSPEFDREIPDYNALIKRRIFSEAARVANQIVQAGSPVVAVSGDITNVATTCTIVSTTTFIPVFEKLSTLSAKYSTHIAGVTLQYRAPDFPADTSLFGRAAARAVSQQQSAIEDEFARLAKEWKDETGFLSRLDRKFAHPAYKQIVAMGSQVVPFILEDLEKNGGHWFDALSELTHYDPLPFKSDCTRQELAAAWIAWGRKHVRKAGSQA